MKLSAILPDHREDLTAAIARFQKRYGLEEDYTSTSSVVRAIARELVRKNTGEDTVDQRRKPFTIKRMVVWDIRGGMDNGIEEAANEEPVTVYGLDRVADSIAQTLESYFEYMGTPAPYNCTSAGLRERLPSFKTQLARNGGDSHIRVYFEDPEGAEHVAIAEIERGIPNATK
jgi:hypothetical protein